MKRAIAAAVCALAVTGLTVAPASARDEVKDDIFLWCPPGHHARLVTHTEPRTKFTVYTTVVPPGTLIGLTTYTGTITTGNFPETISEVSPTMLDANGHLVENKNAIIDSITVFGIPPARSLTNSLIDGVATKCL